MFQVLLDALTAGGLGNVTIYNRGINGGFISYVQPGMRSRLRHPTHWCNGYLLGYTGSV
jgi:hypothetical protein